MPRTGPKGSTTRKSPFDGHCLEWTAAVWGATIPFTMAMATGRLLVLGYQRMAASTYQLSLFAGDQTNCQGSVIATTPPTQLGDGEVWHQLAMGHVTNGYALMPVKRDRT